MNRARTSRTTCSRSTSRSAAPPTATRSACTRCTRTPPRSRTASPRPRRDVFLVALVAASGLLALLWLAFAGASRLLAPPEPAAARCGGHEQAPHGRPAPQRGAVPVAGPQRVGRDHDRSQADGTVAYESPGVERVLGYAPDERIGTHAFELVHPDDLPRSAACSAMSRQPGCEATAEFRVAPRGRLVAHRSRRRARTCSTDPAVGGIVVNYRDVDRARSALEEQLRHQAFHDALTGLPNRALFLDRLEHAWPARRRGPRAARGRCSSTSTTSRPSTTASATRAGDELLVAVAERIRGCLRDGGHGRADGRRRVRGPARGRADVEAPRDVGAAHPRGAAAPVPAPDQRASRPRAASGIALYAAPDADGRRAAPQRRRRDVLAKARARTARGVRAERCTTRRIERLQLQDRPPAGARARASSRSCYQPVVELETAEIAGVEALLRWRHPQRGLIGPTEFIPLAEETGLIVPDRPLGARAGLPPGPRLATRRAAGAASTDERQPVRPPVQDPDLVDDVAARAARARPRAAAG